MKYILSIYIDKTYNVYISIIEMRPTVNSCQILNHVPFQGRNLLDGAKKEDYFLQIGLDGTCLVEKMTNENITCLPPKEVPRTNNSEENVVFIMVYTTYF